MAKIIRLNEQDIERMVKRVLKEGLSTDELKFNYIQDSDEVRDIFKKITGKSGYDDLDSNMFSSGGASDDGDGEGWVLNVDDTNISTREKSMFVDAVMKLGKKKGWNIKQYGDDAIEIYESVNEAKFNYIQDSDEVNDDFEWIRTSLEGRIRDVYGDTELQGEAWEFSERYFPKGAFAGLIGMTEDGEEIPFQGIDNMLNMVNDLGEFTRDEWKLFFANVREYGI